MVEATRERMESTERVSALVAAASRVPLLRSDVRGFARKLCLADAPAAAAEAMATLNGHALQVILVAASSAGAPPDAEVLGEAFPVLPSAEVGLSLFGEVAGDVFDPLMRLARAECLSNERHSLILFASTLALEGRTPPDDLLRLIRLHARRSLSVEAGTILGFAALQSGEAEVQAVVGPWVKAVRTPAGRRLLSKLREIVETPSLELVPERATGPAARPHVRPTEQKVGRNDPCPCGSGKKYKKCCAAKSLSSEEAHLLARTVTQQTQTKGRRERPAAHTTSETAILQLGPREIERLPKEQLPTPQLIVALRKLIGFRRWPEAEACLARVQEREDLPEPVSMYRWELLHEALLADERGLCRRLVRGHERDLPSYLALGLELLDPGEKTLGMLSEVAMEGLRHPEKGALFDLAYALLDHVPTLGVLVARGVLDPRLPLDSSTLLDTVELARDRLLLPPGDPAQTLFELLIHDEAEERAGEEATRMRRESRRVRQEVEEARRKLQELTTASQRLEAATTGENAPPEDAEETQRLRRKVEELKQLVQAGNRQRRQMRDKLEKMQREPADGAAPPTVTPDPEEDEAAWEDATSTRRPVRLPLYGPRFAHSLEAATQKLAGRSVSIAGQLAAGEDGAWSQTKRLRQGSLHSTRIGIHHRLLFRPAADGALEFLELVPREGFETALKRYE